MTTKAINQRIASIDILRAVTMLLMIFVNDLWSLKGIPLWLEHTEANEDGMGLADTVFPAFLFIVGLSIPYAVAARKNKADTTLDIVWHICARSLALVVMGVFLVNGEYLNEAATGMQRIVWNMICCTCFIIIWNAYPKKINRTLVRICKMLAIVTLLLLAWVYRGGEGEAVTIFSTYWWGILGLIGWAYLVSALIYVFSRENGYINIIAWLCFILLCTANHAGLLPTQGWLRTLISPIGEGAMVALVMGGVVVSQFFRYMLQRYTWKRIVVTFLSIGLLLLIAGFILRPIGGISKIKATPSWVLICSAITIVFFMVFYYIADVLNKGTVFNIIKPAGTNTLLCYLLPYYAYGIPVLLGLYLPAVLLTGAIGLIKSFAFALLMVLMAGWLEKLQLRLKL
jgi:heparan-alpha-glucosaminide N-acetyltransferase